MNLCFEACVFSVQPCKGQSIRQVKTWRHTGHVAEFWSHVAMHALWKEWLHGRVEHTCPGSYSLQHTEQQPSTPVSTVV